jgi:hydrogenase expression/formation protein HypC
MCLGIPMRIVEIQGVDARCEAAGVERQVSLFLLQHEALKPGDFVIVHVGYAIQKVGEAEARSAWEIFASLAPEQGAGHA